MTTSVAIDVGSLVGNRTGIGRLTGELVQALDRHDDIDLAPYLLSFRGTLDQGVTRLPLPAALAQRCWSTSRYPSLERWLGSAAVVHGTNFVVPPPRRPTVVSVHDSTPFTMSAQVSSTVRRFPAIIRRAVDGGAWVHTISDHVAAELRSILSTDRIVTVYPGPVDGPVDGPVEPTSLPLGVRAPYVLAIGTLEARKNHRRLVEAFALMHRQLPDLQLVIAGAPGPASNDIQIAIAQGGLTPGQIVLAGFVDDGQRAALMRDAHAMAYPSLDEGFGFPLLEAMRAGVPVVAGNVGALVEVAGGAALMVDPNDTDAIAAALIAICSDNSLRHELVQAGERRSAQFSWQRAAAEMVDLYRTAIRTW
jgi:glycosyltransferase involved in cell wall biosynthesis